MTKIEELKAAFEAARWGLSDHCEFYDKAYTLMPLLLEAVEMLDFEISDGGMTDEMRARALQLLEKLK